MKNLIVAVTLLFAPVVAGAQGKTDGDLGKRVRALEDRAALRTLVDTFSVLADRKDVPKQLLLFAEDAVVESHAGERVSKLTGRKQIGDAFAGYLAGFETVYHINGQHTVELQGDRATGVYYCLVVLIGSENGKAIRNTAGVHYEDEYVRRGHSWLIAKRTAHFAWRDREEMGRSTR